VFTTKLGQKGEGEVRTEQPNYWECIKLMGYVPPPLGLAEYNNILFEENEYFL
jgi:hypothetical protein